MGRVFFILHVTDGKLVGWWSVVFYLLSYWVLYLLFLVCFD